MKVTSYVILRRNQQTTLSVENGKLYMRKSEPNVYLTTNDGSLGIIHDNNKVYAFVEIEKKASFYAFKNVDNQLYFCSRPLAVNGNKGFFLANRVVALDWEKFDLNIIILENSDYFSKILKEHKEKDEIKLYWWRGSNFTNFGDELNLHIVSHLTNKKIRYVDKKQTDLIGIGSILNWFPQRESPYEVWGSGTLSPTDLMSDENYNVSLLRGPLTKSLLKKEVIVPYGDPGILTSLIWDKSSQQVYDWGIIVHFKQVNKPWVEKLLKNTPNTILISVKNRDVANLMLQISSCKNIASTSLHGLIVADSYRIPNIWLWENNLHRGGQWKFFDYFSGINRHYIDNINPVKINSLSDIKFQESDFKYFNQIDIAQNRVVKSFPLK